MKSRGAFALIDLPVVLVFLFFAGIFVAYVFSLFGSPAPWYAWVVSGLVLPVCSLTLGIISFYLETLQSKSRRPQDSKSQSKDSSDG